ncbi:MAG: NADH-quinone oxidoreductase subunit C [Oscillospiraceae bacterium]|nr:NADH-quinone oxidoreductase subunit C [Oscillospiraceae bacterium]
MSVNQVFTTAEDFSALLSVVDKMKKDGFALAQILAMRKDKLDLIYSFERDYELISVHLLIDPDEEIESISAIYPCAYLYENEMKDLFGVKINHINLDFGGHFYKTTVKTPYAPKEETAETKDINTESV